MLINEHLTKKNGAIAKKARLLRSLGKISSTRSSKCKIFFKQLAVAKINQIKDITKFVDLKTNFINEK